MTYAYSDAGDPTALDHDLSGSGDDAQFDFTYTAAHQVASMAQTDPDFLWQATGTCADTYTHNDLNQYPTVAWCGGAAQTHTWSPNGNLTGANIDGTGWTYTYDAENRLLTAAKTGLTVTYAYDPLDHRVSRAATGQATVFSLGDDTRDDEIGDYQPDGTLIQRFIPGPAVDQPIAMVTAAGTRTYFHTDRLGSVIAMSGDTSAKAEGPYTYDPYGRPCGAAGTSTCTLATAGEPFRFTGRRFDPDTRLYYYRARYYSFDLGRFLQTDPIGYQADLNLYTYVGNDPINRTDPTGRCPPHICGAEGATIGSGTDVTLGDVGALRRRADVAGAMSSPGAGAGPTSTLKQLASSQMQTTTEGSDPLARPSRLVVAGEEQPPPNDYQRRFHYQIQDSAGHNVTNADMTIMEHIRTIQGPHGETSEDRKLPMHAGIAVDTVGTRDPPRPGETSIPLIRLQTFTVFLHGRQFDLTTEFRQVTTVEKGVAQTANPEVIRQ